ncbi:hypothetical protein EG68_10379 [Paragonimus skrjabini miyazakii]|uniref:Uncharacterized protein n=1 Tax=Paragonimus skrjabini miyazakii TaxID=59628 RepID=A0A8S9YKH4_9TREM|nr:hypothetical protein EG68_10379 [Paragonimus skrjabini miyazakii]
MSQKKTLLRRLSINKGRLSGKTRNGVNAGTPLTARHRHLG